MRSSSSFAQSAMDELSTTHLAFQHEANYSRHLLQENWAQQQQTQSCVESPNLGRRHALRPPALDRDGCSIFAHLLGPGSRQT